MTYQRDAVPVDANMAALKAYLERTLGSLDAYTIRLDELLEQNRATWQLNGIHIGLTWNDSTAEADPGAGAVGCDNVQWGSATKLYVSQVDFVGRPLGGVVRPADLIGSLAVLRDDNASRYQTYTVDSFEAFDGWTDYSVTPGAGQGSNPAQGAYLDVRVLADLIEVPIG